MPTATETGKALKDKIDAEATAAEAEETPEETPEPVEPQPEPDEGEAEEAEETQPEPEPMTDKKAQQMFDRAMAAFKEKLAAVFGVQPAAIVAAPHPGVIGFMLPGFAVPKAHENFTTCTTCNGIGKVLTGAVTGDQSKDMHVCPDTRCKGNGFWQKAAPASLPPQTGPLAQPPVTATNGEYAEAPAWMGDPNLTPQANPGV